MRPGGHSLTVATVPCSAGSSGTDEAGLGPEQLTGEFKLAHDQVSQLAGQYGGTAQALTLLNTAGVTSSQLLDKNSNQWKIVQQQVKATDAAYRAMAGGTGMLAQDIEILGRAQTDQYQAMQKLNQAMDTFIGDVTGGQSAFDNFALGLKTLAQNFQKAESQSRTLTHSVDGLKAISTTAHATIDGLSQSSCS
jgi:hypothetical protein